MKYLLPFLLLFTACAVVVHPIGGDKDETPPLALKCYPDSQSTNFKDREIRIYFDEYFEIKDQNAILISPPPTTKPKIDVVGKHLRIQFKEALRENTSYTLQLFDALHDINEKNILPAFQLSFSTGNQLDTFFISGKVKNNFTGELNKGYTVALFHPSIHNYPDSVIFPLYLTKTLENGSFFIPAIKNEKYTIYAFDDINNNKRIDIGENMGYSGLAVSAMDTVLIQTAINSLSRPILFTSPIILDNKSFILPVTVPKYTQLDIQSSQKSFDKTQILYSKRIHPDSLLVHDFIKSSLDTSVDYYLLSNDKITDTLHIQFPSTRANYNIEFDSKSLLPTSPLLLKSRQPIRDFNLKKAHLFIQDSVTVLLKKYNASSYQVQVDYPFKEESSYLFILFDSAVHYMDGTFSGRDTFKFRTPSLNQYGDAAIIFSNTGHDSIDIQLLTDLANEAQYSIKTRSDSVYFQSIATGTYTVRLIYLNDSLQPDYIVPFKHQVSKTFINPSKISIRGGWVIGDFILNNEDE